MGDTPIVALSRVPAQRTSSIDYGNAGVQLKPEALLHASHLRGRHKSQWEQLRPSGAFIEGAVLWAASAVLCCCNGRTASARAANLRWALILASVRDSGFLGLTTTRPGCLSKPRTTCLGATTRPGPCFLKHDMLPKA